MMSSAINLLVLKLCKYDIHNYLVYVSFFLCSMTFCLTEFVGSFNIERDFLFLLRETKLKNSQYLKKEKYLVANNTNCQQINFVFVL